MLFYVCPDSNDDFVFLTCSGEITSAEMTSACQGTLVSLAGSHSKRVVVDIRSLKTIPETEQLFDLAKFIWRDFPKGGRIALLVRWEQSRLAKFLELLVRTVGVNLTVFLTQDRAMAWILGGSRQAPPRRLSAKQYIPSKGGSLCPASSTRLKRINAFF